MSNPLDKIWDTVKMIIRDGLLRGWPGYRCPICNVKAGRKHLPYCSIGSYDGGTWA